MKTFWFVVFLMCVATLVAMFTTPTGRVSGSNVSFRDDAPIGSPTLMGAGLALADQHIDDYLIFKVATINGGTQSEFKMIGMPFTGKYYANRVF